MTGWVTVEVGGNAWRARRTLDGRLEVTNPAGRTEVLGTAHEARGAHGLVGPKETLPEAVEAAVAGEEERLAAVEATRVEGATRARADRITAARKRIAGKEG